MAGTLYLKKFQLDLLEMKDLKNQILNFNFKIKTHVEQNGGGKYIEESDYCLFLRKLSTFSILSISYIESITNYILSNYGGILNYEWLKIEEKIEEIIFQTLSQLEREKINYSMKKVDYTQFLNIKDYQSFKKILKLRNVFVHYKFVPFECKGFSIPGFSINYQGKNMRYGMNEYIKHIKIDEVEKIYSGIKALGIELLKRVEDVIDENVINDVENETEDLFLFFG